MANDWTIGVEITDIVGVATGDADSNEAMVMITTKTGVWSGTDITMFATLSSTPVAHGGAFTKSVYVGSGKFIAGTDNGKLYSLYFSAASGDPVVTLMHTGANSVTALAHAEADGSVGFACGNKVYTIPVGGGAATERMDSESVVEAGTRVYDLDYSAKGWVLLVQKADFSHTAVVTTEDWESTVSSGFADDFSESVPLEVNYYEDINGGTWMIGREDGEVKQTTDLDTWRPSGISLWAAVGNDGNVSYSSNGTSWTTYQAFAGTTVGEQAITYGLDGNGDGIWMTPRWWDYDDIGTTSDITAGAVGWSKLDSQMASGMDIAYGDGVWIGIGKSAAVRSTDSGATWTEVGNFSANAGALNSSSVASDGAGNWVIVTHDSRTYQVWKSTDNGLTWTLSKQWGWTSAINWYVKEISYGNGVWVMTTWDKQVQTCTDAGLATNAWTAVTTLPVSDSERPFDVQYAGNSKWMIVGGERMCYFSSDNGASWSAKTVVASGASYSGVSATNVAYYDGAWIAVLNTATQNNIFRSIDDGTTWAAVANTGKNLAGIAYSSVLPNS